MKLYEYEFYEFCIILPFVLRFYVLQIYFSFPILCKISILTTLHVILGELRRNNYIA